MKKIIFAFALLLAATTIAFAKPATKSAPQLDAPQVISDVAAYLNGIKTLKARFTQTDNAGQVTTGDFYLNRPGRMRFQYDAPVTDFIVADGLFIYYYDGQMKQASNAPVNMSLANFFLRKNLTLSGNVSVSDVKKEDGLLALTLVQTKQPNAGSLTLYLADKPMELKKWRIVDPEGAVTEIALSNAETGIALDPELFRYYDPEHKKVKYN